MKEDVRQIIIIISYKFYFYINSNQPLWEHGLIGQYVLCLIKFERTLFEQNNLNNVFLNKKRDDVETQSSVVSISGDQGRRSILFFCLRVWMPSLISLPEKILVSHHAWLISRHARYFVYSQQGRSSVLRSLRSRPTQQKTKTNDDTRPLISWTQ